MRILSIDGGGSRCIIPLTILKYIQHKVKTKKLSDYFDYFTGCSAGAILVCMLLLPESSDLEITLDKYTNLMKSIFHIPKMQYVKNMFGITGPKYDDETKKKELEIYFKDYKIKDLANDVYFPVFDLYTLECMYITKKTHPEFKLLDLLMAATAVPTYFKPWAVEYDNKKHLFIDNGLITNNPCNMVISYVINNYNYYNNIGDFHVISLGTGYYKEPIDEYHDNWGLYKWGSKILNILYSIDINSYQSQCVLKDNFCRLNVELDDPNLYQVNITNKEHFKKMAMLTVKYISDNKILFEKVINDLENLRNKKDNKKLL